MLVRSRLARVESVPPQLRGSGQAFEPQAGRIQK